MPINANIPLQVQGGGDYSQGINMLANAVQTGRQNTRQDRIDQEGKELRDLQVQQAKQTIKDKGKSGAMKDWAFDLTKVKSLIDSNDIKSARHELIMRKAKLVEQQIEDPSVNTNNTDELIAFIDNNDLDSLNNVVNSELAGLGQLGFIQNKTTKTGMASAKSEFLEGGGTRKILPNGEEEIRNRFNKVVIGQDAVDVIDRSAKIVADKEKASQDLRVDTERDIKQVQGAEKQAEKAFTMVDKIRQNITNLEKVIPLIGKGANTGPIVSSLPSFKAATVELENLQKRLGLDVVGAVTFGALSKGELDLAKAVALPTSLQGDALIEWTTNSIAAKRKLATYYEDQAIFLSNGGTRAGWYLHLKEKQGLESGAAGQQEITDGQTATNPQTGEKIIYRGGQWQAQ